MELQKAKHKMFESNKQIIKALNVGYHQLVKLFEDTEDNEVDPQGGVRPVNVNKHLTV